jgi:hypothetical protein
VTLGRCKRERRRAWARSAFVLGVVAAASCSVYDQGLLSEATGAGGILGSGGGNGGAGGSGGNGGAGGSGGSAGKGAGGTGGASGASGSSGNGGSTGGKAGSGGASGANAGSSGKGGNGGTTTAGNAGNVTDGGEGGEPVDPCLSGGDCCPDDDTKTEAGQCGCGVPDTDTDEDATADCNDMCPNDATRTIPGECGCGAPALADADCATLKMALVNRYSFSGTGTVIEDSVGDADGTLMQEAAGTAAQSGGVLTLPGGITPVANDPSKAYVALPTGCLSGLTDATFETWVNWATCTGTTCSNNWQRVFDFGAAAGGSTGSYIFLTPRANLTNTPVFSASSTMGNNNELTTGHRVDHTMIAAGLHHFAVVVDGTNAQVRLYVDGMPATAVNTANTGALAGSLASITDTNCWLGRSNFSSDVYFNGSFDEFRIYDAALSASVIAASHTAGKDAGFL